MWSPQAAPAFDLFYLISGGKIPSASAYKSAWEVIGSKNKTKCFKKNMQKYAKLKKNVGKIFKNCDMGNI